MTTKSFSAFLNPGKFPLQQDFVQQKAPAALLSSSFFRISVVIFSATACSNLENA
jgi:hypothetical protein